MVRRAVWGGECASVAERTTTASFSTGLREQVE